MSLNEHWKEHFGDDRCLTQRLTNHFGAMATDIQTDLVSETQAAFPVITLIEQRRRWLLGTIAIEAAALCSRKTWTDSLWQWVYRLWLQVGVESDVRSVSMFYTANYLRGGAKAAIISAVLAVLITNMATLRSYPEVNRRLSIPMHACTLALLPLMNFATRIYALVSLWERSWGSTRKC